MDIKEVLGGIAGAVLMLAMLIAAAALGSVFLYGAAWASTRLMPWFSLLSFIAFGVAVFILLPLAIPRATRPFSSIALLVASYVFGATLWMEGLLLTLSIWGTAAVFLGLFMAGIGVVPIAIVATAINGLWPRLIELILLTIMTFASRAGAISLADSLE